VKTEDISGYVYESGEHNSSHDYILPCVLRLLNSAQPAASSQQPAASAGKKLFEVGCGNGSVASAVTSHGWNVTGVDPSDQGIQYARAQHPEINLHQGSAYDDLATQYGFFPVVLSLEVVEHVYDPRRYAATVFSLLEPGGTAIISTPYHGYIKNLAMAVSGRMDAHFTALWDHGHIKFWSYKTLSALLLEAGFVDIQFERVGRIPPLAKSMIAIARKPFS
jgi:2-polyprenyl-6-hydroxyphenyl methylase/3-demethylubiquinone-9 3-methyltransferase